MSDVRMVKLGDICTFMHGGTPKKSIPEYWEGNIPWISSADISIDSKITFRSYISESGVKNSSTNVIPARTVLLVNRTGVGKTTITTVPTAISQDITAIYHNNRIITEYLHYFLESKKNYFISYSRGATIQGFNRQTLEELEIPILSLEEQKRIVSILDKAKSIQEARERQLAALDELASSLFVKYFGHPSLSPKYKTVSIGDICKVATGNSPSKKDINNYGNVIEWVKSDNLGGLHPSKAKEYLSEQGKDKGRVAPPGSILVTCIAGSRNSIGKCSLVDREITFNQQINAIYPSNNILSDFLYYQIKIFPYLVQEKISGGMKGIVNKSKFESIKIILPPKEIQEEFSKITQRIRIQKEYAQKSLDLSKNLFSSLEITLFDH